MASEPFFYIGPEFPFVFRFGKHTTDPDNGQWLHETAGGRDLISAGIFNG